MSASVKFDSNAADCFIDRAFGNLMRAGDYLAELVRENISTPGPEASAPGEYPHRQSGELKGSVYVRGERNSLTVEIVADAEHAAHVDAARPFLERSMDESMPELIRIATGD